MNTSPAADPLDAARSAPSRKTPGNFSAPRPWFVRPWRLGLFGLAWMALATAVPGGCSRTSGDPLISEHGTNEVKGTWPVSYVVHRFSEPTPTSGPKKILKVESRKITELAQIVADLSVARVVLIGELHDRYLHHWAQLQVIRALTGKGVPLAIGLEMFQRQNQPALDRWVAGLIPENQFVELFGQNWSADYWPVYRDIFVFARDSAIPMVGLNLPRGISKKIATQGFEALTPEELTELPGVTNCNVGPEYRRFIERALGGSGHHGVNFDRFCEAQLVWDATMAHTVLTYLGANASRHMVVLAGSGHAWKEGIPQQLQRHSPLPFRVILPEMPLLTRDSITTQEGDYLWLDLTPETR